MSYFLLFYCREQQIVVVRPPQRLTWAEQDQLLTSAARKPFPVATQKFLQETNRAHSHVVFAITGKLWSPPPPLFFVWFGFWPKSNLKQKNSRNQQMGGKSDSFSNSNIMRFTEPLWNKPLMDFCELFCIKMKTLPWLPCSAVIGLFWCCLRQAPKGT